MDKLLANTKIEIGVEIDEESNIIWQAGANCRFVVLRFQLFVPMLTFNSEGQEFYTENYLKPHKFLRRQRGCIFYVSSIRLFLSATILLINQTYYKWTYLNETMETSVALRQRTGHFSITNGILKRRIYL